MKFHQNYNISIIIPCHNSEDWIEKCLESIIKNQESTVSFEIITINDCSNDRTSSILKKYEKNRNIKNIELRKKSGVSKARNIGINEANGMYIWCIDSDDYIMPNAWKKISNMLQNFPDQDMYAFGYESGNGIAIGFQRGPYRSKKKAGSIKSTSDGIFQLFSGMRMYPWNKIIKRDLFLKYPFPEGKIFEDIHTIASITANCKSIYWIKDALIFYYSNPKSQTSSMLPERCKDLYFSLDQFLLENKKKILSFNKKTQYSIKSLHLKHCIDAICHLAIYNKEHRLSQANTLDLINDFTKKMLPHASSIQRNRLLHLRYQIWRSDRGFLNYLSKNAMIDIETVIAIAIKRIKPRISSDFKDTLSKF